MADGVDVTATYLDGLAGAQSQIAEDIGSATKPLDGISDSLWINHGVVSGATNMEVTVAEATRRSAGAAMQTLANQLATNLSTAAVLYDSTDAQAGQSLDNQMPTG